MGGENIFKIINLIDIHKADTVSSLWKFAGFHTVNGKVPKRQKGTKLEYNPQLRSMCWRLANSLLRSGMRHFCTSCGALRPPSENIDVICKCGSMDFESRPITKFSDYYTRQKRTYLQRFAEKGVRVVPASELPTDSHGKKYEPEGVISEGHIHNMALRKVIKLFLSCLWEVCARPKVLRQGLCTSSRSSGIHM